MFDNRLVILEGVNGSGKTTIKDILVNDYNYKSVTVCDEDTKKKLSELEGDNLTAERLKIYKDGIIRGYGKAMELVIQGYKVVLDRSFLSYLIYNFNTYTEGNVDDRTSMSIDDLYKISIDTKNVLMCPILVVILSANIDTILSRLVSRDNSNIHTPKGKIDTKDNSSFIEAIKYLYDAIEVETVNYMFVDSLCIKINTDETTPSETAKLIVESTVIEE